MRPVFKFYSIVVRSPYQNISIDKSNEIQQKMLNALFFVAGCSSLADERRNYCVSLLMIYLTD